jgi:solute carrier family 34 (sodium-dependent phosphate cotransporter)
LKLIKLNAESERLNNEIPPAGTLDGFRIALSLIGTLVLFVFAIKFMVASLYNMGSGLSEVIGLATINPFNGLFIGLLVTAVLQSSSTTTSMLVAFVASGSMTVQGAVPIIMGANIGTTITSTLVSLGFINKKKEFKRAVAAGTYHDFFNILTAAILFPLEYYYQFLTRLSSAVAQSFFDPTKDQATQTTQIDFFGTDTIVEAVGRYIPAIGLVLMAVAFLFLSILLFRRIVSKVLKVKQPESFGRFFFESPLKSFTWGVLLTGAIRSSTITTSVVVPIVAKNFISLKKAAPFILGANIGTTVTAFIAVLLYAHSREALIIALVHLFFNLFGVLLFFPIPGLRQLPLFLANALGKLTIKYRIAGFIYIIATFFLIPFLLIAVSR